MSANELLLFTGNLTAHSGYTVYVIKPAAAYPVDVSTMAIPLPVYILKYVPPISPSR